MGLLLLWSSFVVHKVDLEFNTTSLFAWSRCETVADMLSLPVTYQDPVSEQSKVIAKVTYQVSYRFYI